MGPRLERKTSQHSAAAKMGRATPNADGQSTTNASPEPPRETSLLPPSRTLTWRLLASGSVPQMTRLNPATSRAAEQAAATTNGRCTQRSHATLQEGAREREIEKKGFARHGRRATFLASRQDATQTCITSGQVRTHSLCSRRPADYR